MRRIKTIKGYTALRRWLDETSADPVAWLARGQVEEIKTPYCYSPSVSIVRWHGDNVVWFETAHRRYEVYAVPPELLRFNTEQAATDWHVRFCAGQVRQ